MTGRTAVRRWIGLWVAGLATFSAVAEGRADRIQLRGGGEVKGVVVKDASHPQQVMVQTETGSKPVAFQKTQVVGVIKESSVLDDYFTRRDKIEATGEAQYQFGSWCEQHKLSGLAQVHYQRAVELDKTHAAAHKKLGHVLYNETWLTYDALREAQGMVKVKGRWVSRQKQDQLANQGVEKADQGSWSRRIKILYRKLSSGSNDERTDAERQLAAIQDPAAIPGLVKILGMGTDGDRARLAHILGAIAGPVAQDALVTRVLSEPDVAVRKVALDELIRRKESDTSSRFGRALRSEDPIVLGRAAWALAGLGVKAAVPKLVPLLVQVERKTYYDPAAGSGGGNMNVTFGQVVGAPGLPATGANAGAAGGGGFVTQRAYPMVGAVVGPGVAAYGAVGVPFASGASLGGGGVGLWPGEVATGPATRNMPASRTDIILHPNHDVLAALESLTGRNFGFNFDAWNEWLNTEFRVEQTPARRARQPGQR
jgi:hypothetical protein